MSRFSRLSALPKSWLLIALLWAPALSFASQCPVSVPITDEIDGAIRATLTRGRFGDESLAALVPADGTWRGMGASSRYRDKFWWWRKDSDARTESSPNLKLHAVKLDDSGIEFDAGLATAGYGPGWDSMLVMLEFPSPGCWQVTGSYRDTSLTMVFEVVDLE